MKRLGTSLIRRAVAAVGLALLTAGLAPTQAASAATTSTLSAGQSLSAGTQLTSPSGAYVAAMQTDGNFVEYGPTGPVWQSGTAGIGDSATLVMQGDGNLVIYRASGGAVWASGTNPSSGDTLVLQDDGNLVIYRGSGGAVWGDSGNRPSTLYTGRNLSAGQALYSATGGYQAVMQGDGNFVVYGPSGATWASNTSGTGGNNYLAMQGDGNLVVYQAGGHAVWGSSTNPSSNDRLVMQSDGNLVVYTGDGAAVWASKAASAGSGQSSAGSSAAQWAMSQNGVVDSPSTSYCNRYTAHWGAGTGSGCSNGTRAEPWCSDFAAEAWQQAGVSFTYGQDLTAASSSFYRWGVAHGTWHPAGSGYTPQPGDAVLFGTPSSAAHVGIFVSGSASAPNVVNGDMWRSSGIDEVYYWTGQTTNGGGAALSGYVAIPRR